jgi:antitoxin component YwqK of YwqJK toxin-antitoxin module
MRYSLLLLFLILISCKKKRQSFFDEKDYYPISSKADSITDMRMMYRNKYNPTYLMIKTYWNDGLVQAVSYFHGNVKEGKWMQYHDNGKLFIESEYKKDRETGTWKYYDEKGRLYKTEKYE